VSCEDFDTLSTQKCSHVKGLTEIHDRQYPPRPQYPYHALENSEEYGDAFGDCDLTRFSHGSLSQHSKICAARRRTHQQYTFELEPRGEEEDGKKGRK